MRLTRVTSWKMGRVTAWDMNVLDMCATAAGDIAVRMGYRSGEIQLCDRTGKTRTTYTGLCTCVCDNKSISELIPGQYLAQFCENCNDIKVVDMVTHKVHKAYSGSSEHTKLWGMCSGPVEGSLLVWDRNSKSVIELQWNEGKKQLKEVRRVHVQVQASGGWVLYMCYIPHTDLVILSHYDVVQAVKLHGGAGQTPVWQLKGEVLGKEIVPWSVSCDSEGRVYVADKWNSRVLLLNGYTGEVIQQLLQDTGLGYVSRVCCLSNPHQLLVKDDYTLTLYNITSQ